ncbi:acryloyl-CoA reductase [Terribacillus saccharophilus]|uniref:NADPH:quinone oxidoreductase family protein n=1 Tax=Terribacillus saccharophilus TaxID=361277 RepID=UPI0038258441
MEKTFGALIVNKDENSFQVTVKEIDETYLPKNDTLIKVHYSGINYKDGLAAQANGKIVKDYPFIPGIDLAGEVVRSDNDKFKPGDKVIATSYDLGVSHFGGYSKYASIPSEWILPLPKNMTLKESMILGTAGFTAGLSVQRLEDNGLRPENGKVLVTGASGGVGGLSVAMLSKKGYTVVASTGKEKEHEYLKGLGASEIIPRDEVYDGTIKSLSKQQWAAAIDPVGGKPLASLLSKIQYGGSVAVSGLTAGGSVPTTVYPFILRGVNLLGIDSVYCPMEKRKKVWERISTDLKPSNLEALVAKEITLDDLPHTLPAILAGTVRGRILVRMQ